MAEIKGDMQVRRTVIADRRADQGLLSEVLSANRLVKRHDHHWLSLDGGAAVRIVELPDATACPKGWKVVVHNIGATNDISVAEFNATSFSGAVLKVVPFVPAPSQETAAYEFVLIDNATAAGVWYVVELGDPTIAGVTASKFVANFVIADWPAAVGDYQELTVAEVVGLGAATHGRGINPVYILQEKIGANYDKTMADRERMSGAGNLALRIVDGLEFDGRVIFV